MPDGPNDWEDVDIPDKLAKKWEEDETKGLAATPCAQCGHLLSQDDLSCPVCETPKENRRGALQGLKWFFTNSPIGIMLLIAFLGSLIALLLYP